MSKAAVMRRVLVLLACLMVATTANAQVRVKGYTKKDGTYVAPHYRSSPNSTKLDNYSTRGNVDPYTGQSGTANPYPTSSYQYQAPASAYVAQPRYAPAPVSYDADLSSGIRNPKSLSSWEVYEGDSDDEDEDEGSDSYDDYGDDE